MKRILPALLLALSAAIAFADELKLREDAPDRYVVVKGDTLWDISARFLNDPWLWPELWGMNRDTIKNPHLIYPGDVVVIDKTGGQPKAALLAGQKRDTVKLSPQVRSEPYDRPIPPIPLSAIGPFLSQPLVVEEGALDKAPQVIAAVEERFMLGAGDRAFATAGTGSSGSDWKIVRPGRMLRDPDTGTVLGQEVEYVGDARTLVAGNPQRIGITRAVVEVLPKDRLVAADTHSIHQYVPRAPEKAVSGRVMAAYGAVGDAGQFNTVLLNRGRADGLEEGHVLAIYAQGRLLAPESRDESSRTVPGLVDITCLRTGARVAAGERVDTRSFQRPSCVRGNPDEGTRLPSTRSGLAFVYRVFDRVSYALIMSSTRPIYLLDTVKNP